ncbi:hypothetical protein J6590_057245 [Homalodisca vitripennis]|nr:hypothetical protein J6590_057245 [Homalodisca vitripennis]
MRGATTSGGVVGGGCRDVAVLIRSDTATAPAPRCNLQGLAVLALNMCYIGALSFTRCCTCRRLPQKLLLKPFVVPSIKLPTISNDDDDVRNERIEKRRVRKNAIERLDSLSPKKPRIEPLNTDRLDESNIVQPSSVCEKCENLLEENNNLNSSIDVL